MRARQSLFEHCHFQLQHNRSTTTPIMLQRRLCCTSMSDRYFCVCPPYCPNMRARICHLIFLVLTISSALLLAYATYLIMTDRLTHTEGKQALMMRMVMIIVCVTVFILSLSIAMVSLWYCCKCRILVDDMENLSDYEDQVRWGWSIRDDLGQDPSRVTMHDQSLCY